MRKKLLFLISCFAVAMFTVAMAQSPEKANCPKAKTECCQKADGEKKACDSCACSDQCKADKCANCNDCKGQKACKTDCKTNAKADCKSDKPCADKK